jgi:hypothetical protein
MSSISVVPHRDARLLPTLSWNLLESERSIAAEMLRHQRAGDFLPSVREVLRPLRNSIADRASWMLTVFSFKPAVMGRAWFPFKFASGRTVAYYLTPISALKIVALR